MYFSLRDIQNTFLLLFKKSVNLHYQLFHSLKIIQQKVLHFSFQVLLCHREEL